MGMDYAFQYIESNPLELESDYPYTAHTFPPRVLVRSSPTRMLPETPPVDSSELPFPRPQSPLLSRPINSSSRDITMVSSPPGADPDSTTVSSPSDTVVSVTCNTSS